MGVNNQQRRRAKQKDRARRGAPPAGGFCPDCGGVHRGGRPDAAQQIDDLLWDACVAVASGDPARVGRIVQALMRLPGSVDALHARLLATIRDVWGLGWQPAELLRVSQKQLGQPHVDLLKDLVATQRTEYATATVAEAWDAQLDAIGAVVWWEPGTTYWTAKEARTGLSRAMLLRIAAELLRFVASLPGIGVIGPIPGEGRRGSLGPQMVNASADLRMRDKVRALLAKAESSEFTEEAEALTAKAQELMARYSIDYALLAATKPARDHPAAIRVGLDNPYEDAKALLLQGIAEANSSRAVWSKEFGHSTLVGYAADLASVEMLYTSLLVQATGAMIGQGRDRQSRTPSFRRSFLYAFALRIAERLQAASERVGQTANAESNGALMPVLAAKQASVDEMATELLGEVGHAAFGPTNHHGWASGRAAADLAGLTAHTSVAR
jgi:hypothetical protein